jgi:hypothetical protein
LKVAVKNLRPWREEFGERDVRAALRDAGLPHWRFTVWCDSSMSFHPPDGRSGPQDVIPITYIDALRKAFAPDAVEIRGCHDGNGRHELWVDLYWLRSSR